MTNNKKQTTKVPEHILRWKEAMMSIQDNPVHEVLTPYLNVSLIGRPNKRLRSVDNEPQPLSKRYQLETGPNDPGWVIVKKPLKPTDGRTKANRKAKALRERLKEEARVLAEDYPEEPYDELLGFVSLTL
jgi:hypothetical protein